MKIHEIRGASMRDALERARSELGSDAVVITHKPTRGGGVRLAVTRTVPRSTRALERLQTEARSLLTRRPSGPGVAAGTEDVERAMRATGASKVLIDRVAEAVAGRLPERKHPLDLAAEEIGMIFPVARALRAPGAISVLTFVGRTGVGKTTCLLKLAGRLARAGRRVALATLDAGRTASLERLRAFGKRLNAPVLALSDAARLPVELSRLGPIEVVLLDTTGNLTRDVDQVRRLTEAFARSDRAARVDTYLVSSAILSLASQDEALRTVEPLGLAGTIVTKIDETLVPTPTLEHALHSKLPIAFLTDGPDLARHFHRPKPEHFADLVLRGRLK